MGQYYRVVNIDKREYLSPSDYHNLLKLMEHSYARNEFVDAVVNLLAKEWKGDRIVWAGDYGDEGLFTPLGYEGNLYNYAQETFAKIENANIQSTEKYSYICNEDTKIFVELKGLPKNDDDYVIHPLPLLTASGNGRGGGDYQGSDENLCGYWAADQLFVSNTVPEGYTEFNVHFV
ncbi:MAG TPA: hypothetical protein VFC84_02165 [Desulfosporosinus sp.]|nr:hypothetical protein [Desulfosporosinus sp.]